MVVRLVDVSLSKFIALDDRCRNQFASFLFHVVLKHRMSAM